MEGAEAEEVLAGALGERDVLADDLLYGVALGQLLQEIVGKRHPRLLSDLPGARDEEVHVHVYDVLVRHAGDIVRHRPLKPVLVRDAPVVLGQGVGMAT